MDNYYILLNLALFAVLLWGISKASEEERKDVLLLNKKFEDISDNKQCLDYLQLVATIPTWRFAIFSSTGYTLLLFLLYVLSGNPVTTTVMFVTWGLWVMNTIFIYKTVATRDFHYMCKNNCQPEWKHSE